MKKILTNLGNRIRALHPDHFAIAKGMVWVSLFVFLAKISGAVKEMAVAARYGVSETLDAYLFIFNLVTWPVSVWFSVLAIVLIPLAARIKKESPSELPRFRAELLGLTVLLGLVLFFVCLLGLPLLMYSHWTGLSLHTVTTAVSIVPILSSVVFFGILVSLFSSWTLFSGRHVNTLLEGVPSFTILIVLLIFSSASVMPLAWATCAGFMLNAVILAITLFKRGEIETPAFAHRSPYWLYFWQGFGVMMVGQVLMSFTGVIDQFFAGHLSSGSVATISYANRVLTLILSLGAVAVSRATLPVFSKIKAQGRDSRRMAIHWAHLLFGLGVVAILVNWCFAHEILKLIFERGAFTAKDTKVVTEVFRYGLFQVPFYFSCLVLVSFWASQRRYLLIAVGAGVNLLVKVISNFIFVPWLGVKGVFVATTLMYVGSFAFLYFFMFFFRDNRGEV